MFDYLTVNKNFLPSVKEMEDRGYVFRDFQTKDLENCLFEFYVDENGRLWRTIVRYACDEFGSATLVPGESRILSKSIEKYDFTGDVVFYDHFSSEEKDHLGIDLKLTFVDGVAKDVAKVIDVQITDIEEIKRKNDSFKKLEEKRGNDPLYNFLMFFSDKSYRVSRFFNKCSKFFSDFSLDLRRRAVKLHPLNPESL